MAEIAVSFVLERLTSFLQNESWVLKNKSQLVKRILEELENIRDELQRIKPSLREADLVEENDQELKEWIRQVRDIAYDTEDIIDQFKLDVPEQQENRINAFLCNFCCIIEKSEGFHPITVEVQKIRTRITNISNWQVNCRDKLKLNTIKHGSSSSMAGDALLLDSIDLVGIDEPQDQLIKWLTRGSSNRKVISVVGMGGSGKTTLIKQTYDAVQVRNHFKVQVWVTISQPLRMGELLRNTVQQLFTAIRKPVPAGMDTMNNDQLQVEIKSFLQKYRYLIILDNVWHVKEWHALNHALAKNNYSSRVIITTQKTNVAKTSCREPQDQIFNIEPLSQQDSWALFCRKFGGSTCPPHLVDISKRILKRCEGLPLAIVAISGVLATKKHIAEWNTVLHNLGAEIEDNNELKSLKEVLLLSINDLPCHLKSCFLYLSIFPENHLIEKMRLIRLWTAEGFVEVNEGKTREEVAEDYLNELLNRNLMQVAMRTSDGRVKRCRIHDILREIVMLRSRDQNIAVMAKEHDERWPVKVRRLSIQNKLNDVRHNWKDSHIRSLFMLEVEDHLSGAAFQHLFTHGFRLLRVLDLRASRLEVFPSAIVMLLLLNYLSLRDTMIKTIPSSIEQLQNLETLDLKHTYVTELPIQILKLNQLCHLLVYRYEFKHYSRIRSKYGCKALAGIGALRFLQTLCFIKADHGNAPLITELGELKQLRRLGIMNLERSQGKILCSSIEKLINLQALSVTSSSKDEVIDLQYLSSPPPYLQRLYLTGRLKNIPEWIPSLHSLVKIFLKWSQLESDPLESLQDLPNLVHLELLQACQVDTLSFNAGGFEKLKVLGIDKLDELRCIQVEKGAIPCIEKISILRCKLLNKLPYGIEHLSMLKMLEFFDMPEELIKTLHPGVPGGDYWKVANIPGVYYTYCRDGEVEAYSLESSGERALSTHEIAASRTKSIVNSYQQNFQLSGREPLWKTDTLMEPETKITLVVQSANNK